MNHAKSFRESAFDGLGALWSRFRLTGRFLAGVWLGRCFEEPFDGCLELFLRDRLGLALVGLGHKPRVADETEVTEKMIFSALGMVSGFNAKYDDEEEVIADIYRAMDRAIITRP